PTYRQLREEVARYCGHGVEASHVVLGNGADEVIDLVLRATLDPGDEVVNLPPTFGMYEFFARLNRSRVVDVPRDEDFRVQPEAVRNALTPRTKVIVVCSPNNPTGNPLPWEHLLALLETGRLVLLDETYYEFHGETAAPLLREWPNLVIVRSLSKWAGLAGLRLGYGLMAPALADFLQRMRPPYNVNAAAAAAALASLRHADVALCRVRKIVEERERLFARLLESEVLRPLPSRGNFLLCFVEHGAPAALRAFLEAQGIWLRWYGRPPLERAVRITVGRPEDSDRIVDALAAWRDRP
ncbi:MAG: histidinol-phosphate aminotransferase family protein, partial [Anaerolineae bacterium]|nr:histidinol-phosphate aminotransferase family protein [Anaerolineae bacterium]